MNRMSSSGKILNTILVFTHLRPISLAGKCRLLFGIAIVFVLTLALLTPYFWMGKLTEKSVIDAGRAVVNTVYERHFRLGKTAEKSPVMLDESGVVKQAQASRIKWVKFNTPGQPDWQSKTDTKLKNRIE
jgi:hypothetical protein